jgi:hypothetical protein
VVWHKKHSEMLEGVAMRGAARVVEAAGAASTAGQGGTHPSTCTAAKVTGPHAASCWQAHKHHTMGLGEEMHVAWAW